MAALFALAMATVAMPDFLPGNPSLRVQHIGAFLVLSMLAAWAYPRRSLPALFVGLVLFSGLIELVQTIPSLGRVAEWSDWALDSAVIAVTLFVVSALRNVRRKERRPRAEE